MKKSVEESPPVSDLKPSLTKQVPSRNLFVLIHRAVTGNVGDRKQLRQRIYEILEVGRGEDRTSMIVDVFLITLILINVVAFALETVPAVAATYGIYLTILNVTSVLIFTIEYALRLWSCVEVPFLNRLSPLDARMRFAMRPYLIIDLLAIAPFYLSFLLPLDMRILRVLRLFRLLKLARYSPAMHTLVRVISNERRALLGVLLIMAGVLLFASTGIYYLERDAQPLAFGNIPDAAWWAISTLTTVGYGDVSPVTPLGKLFGSMVMLLGLGMFALPIAIISTGFAQEVGRRDFVVTWSLMARIPLFAELESGEIAELMPYLNAHNFPPHWEVIRAGNPGRQMYFIASGKICARAVGNETTLTTGDFFGEVALLRDACHECTYVTATRARLLRLDREDFERLERANPEIANHIREISADRIAARSTAARATFETHRS